MAQNSNTNIKSPENFTKFYLVKLVTFKMFAFLILQPVLYRYRKLSKAALHPTALILLYILDLTVE